MTNARNTIVIGSTYCTLSAVMYGVFYGFQTHLSKLVDASGEPRHDPAWINLTQAMTATALIGVFMLFKTLRGVRVWPALPQSIALMALGFLTQIGGLSLLWALPKVGVSIAMVLQTGVMLATGAILGLLVLGERVTWHQVIAIAMITMAVFSFSYGAPSGEPEAPAPAVSASPVAAELPQAAAAETPPADASPASPKPKPWDALFGIALATLAGMIFGGMMVAIRKFVTGDTSVEAISFYFNGMALVTMGPLLLWTIGVEPLFNTPGNDLFIMLISGPMNLIALLLVTISLKMISVVRSNVINNGLTTAVSVLIGIFWFKDPLNQWILIGMGLSLAGIILISMVPPVEGEAPADAAGFPVVSGEADRASV